MDWKLYFETEPWSYAVGMINNGDLGSVSTFGIQAACAADALDQTLEQWQTRLNQLFGQPVVCDKLAGEHAVSLLLRYDGPVVGRVFIDRNADAPFCNFEIVGAKALLLWKPEVCALSKVTTPDKTVMLYQHPCLESLAKENIS